jgi:hypothetical protein
VPKNKLSDLRDHLFETLEALKDPEKPMEIARAKAIADVAQTIINSATVEVKAMNAINADTPEFFDKKKGTSGLPAATGPANGRSVRSSTT